MLPVSKKRSGQSDSRQYVLPLDAGKNERRSWLVSALNITESDAQVRTLLLAIHKIVDDGELLRERKRIADDPDVGFSSQYVVMRTARRAEEAGLLIVRENKYVHGGQRQNGYRIDFDRVRELATRRGQSATAHQVPRSRARRRTAAHGGARGGAPAHGVVRQRTPIKEYQSTCLPSEDSNHPPPADPPSGWEAVEEEICKELTDWQTPIRAARGRVTPDHVLRVLQHYRAAGGIYGPGALHRRLCRAHPAVPPDSGWPPPGPPSAGCRRAMDRLAASRAHLAATGQAFDDEEFARRFAAHLGRFGLADYAAECLFRDRLARAARS